MEWIAILLVFLSAIMHAGWNLLGKMQTIPSLHFFIMATLMASLVLSLGIPVYWDVLIELPYLHLILISGYFQVLYLSGLAKSYRFFDLSIAYPIIRALPVILVPIFGSLLAFITSYDTQFTIKDWLAYTIIICGTLLLLPKRMDLSLRYISFLALAAFGTTGYSITDHYIQRQWSSVSSANPFILGYLYIVLQGWATVVVGLCFLLITPNRDQASTKKQWKNWTQAGLVISGSYFLILVAMIFVTKASDIVAFRQISIPIGFLLGIVVMKENTSRKKLISVSVICVGLALVSFN